VSEETRRKKGNVRILGREAVLITRVSSNKKHRQEESKTKVGGWFRSLKTLDVRELGGKKWQGRGEAVRAQSAGLKTNQ